jgi:uncharacterized protein (TIGR02217 family)
MAFTVDPVRLPVNVERGAVWGPMFKTTLLFGDNAVETPIQNWAQCRYSGTLSYGMMNQTDYDEVRRFFMARRGMARGFLFKDWTDYTMVRQQIGTGDGTEDTYLLTKLYADSVNAYIRIITRPVRTTTDTLKVWVDGVLKTVVSDYQHTPEGGLVFTTPPSNGAVLEASCDFDNACRFDQDQLNMQIAWSGAASIENFRIIELNDRNS